tara:strand:+ start:656 stop:2089 length:1434 start_codon:yes stop_codon:yes gene_type:complete
LIDHGSAAWLLVGLVHITVIVRAVVIADRDPYARAAWLLLLVTLPVIGVALYILFGEPWISRGERLRWRRLSEELLAYAPCSQSNAGSSELTGNAFRTFEATAGWTVAAGNRASLLPDSDAAIATLVADIDAARHSVHLSFYIWLGDRNGTKVVDAVCRSARRGVRCRIAADAIGSRSLIRSTHWKRLNEAGAQLCELLPAPLGLGFLVGRRTDLRNHRKIAVIDGQITYCGSQNCADPDFLVKAAFAPWVDIMLRFEGPVARQADLIFTQAWAMETCEDVHTHFAAAVPDIAPNGFPAIAAGTSPLTPRGAMSDMFVAAVSAARTTICITTPYFAPDPSLANAIVAAARRGVDVRIIFPHRNDSRIIGAISRAYYPILAGAGVRIFEFRGGLLHAKTLVVDDRLVLIGSSNMDRRSLDLNYENNILLESTAIAAMVRNRQEKWLEECVQVEREDACSRPLARRLGDNLLTMIAPVF